METRKKPESDLAEMLVEMKEVKPTRFIIKNDDGREVNLPANFCRTLKEPDTIEFIGSDQKTSQHKKAIAGYYSLTYNLKIGNKYQLLGKEY